MGWVYGGWVLCVLLVVVLALCVATSATRRPVPIERLNILRDTRGRYSLNQFQVVAWTTALVSLFGGVAIGRLMTGCPTPLGFDVPAEVLGVLGISAGTSVLARSVKARKVHERPECVAAHEVGSRAATFFEMPRVEEGVSADQVVDVGKFQKFVITAFLVTTYVAQSIAMFAATERPDEITSLPGLSGSFLTLMAISHAGYVASKLPSPPGVAAPTSMADRINAQS